MGETADYGINAEELDALSNEISLLEKMQPSIGVVTNERKSAGRSIKDLIAEAHSLLDKLDDGFEGLIDDDRFIESWFTIRKIRGRHKIKDKKATKPA